MYLTRASVGNLQKNKNIIKYNLNKYTISQRAHNSIVLSQL